jgi:hypothetical protein
MKAVERRLHRREGRLGRALRHDQVSAAAWTWQHIPDGLEAQELGRYLREHVGPKVRLNLVGKLWADP